ncbi:roadblock/LC7 domain-containing protein [Desulfoluna sp.]|uniref:roadblock/LC7 domain-containing protein n=1 Tax=Desulfoluna sp. TaxID=2045199 RepID=UPI0026345A5E|nr:roadblock/LC7 domain-containing protein [Desulfoluna sp.]
MTTILDFIKIARIKGVKSYCLVSAEGRRMAGNATDTFCKELAQVATEGAGTTQETPLAPPISVSIRSAGASLIIIPVGNYTLSVTPASNVPEGQLIADVLAFLHRIRHQHTVSQKS